MGGKRKRSPKLKKKLKSHDGFTRRQLAVKILEMDPADHEAQLTLLDLIRCQTPFARQAIDDLVYRAKPLAREILPALREAQKSGTRSVREAARWALKKLEAKQ